MQKPSKVLDLHTHLFNSNYLPLEGIISHAMGKSHSILARNIARILEHLTGTSYNPRELAFSHSHGEAKETNDEEILEELWLHVEDALLTVRSNFSPDVDKNQAFNLEDQENVLGDDLMMIVGDLERDLERLDKSFDKAKYGLSYSSFVATIEMQQVAFFGPIKYIVKKAFKLVVKLMDKDAWGQAENYLEFFLTMLYREEKMVRKILKAYKKAGIDEVELSHYMMDMHPTYQKYHTESRPPKFSFYPTQIDHMSRLQSNHSNVHGFSAFHPYRENWKEVLEFGLEQGMKGVKFYPAMEYKPFGDDDEVVRERISAFLDFCVAEENDLPVFVHCTPIGFQTKEKLGQYAHPKYWKQVLDCKKWSKLRLCFGHSGGGRIKKNSGWMCETEEQWNCENNYARIVSELCSKYDNVYCELGYILDMVKNKGEAHRRLKLNFDRAKAKTEIFANKIAFGTDWHMPQMIDEAGDYLLSFVEFVNAYYLKVGDEEPELKERVDDFFWNNGRKYLKLT